MSNSGNTGATGELVPPTDVSPWNLLHDGRVTAIGHEGDGQVTITIDIPYLGTRLGDPSTGLVLTLLDCSDLEYTPYGGAPVTSIELITAAQPDVIEAKYEDDRVVVWGSEGVLRLRYRGLALRTTSGTPLPLEALNLCAQSYWEEWADASDAPSEEDLLLDWRPWSYESVASSLLEGDGASSSRPS